MKIIEARKIECHKITVEGGDWQFYTRYGPDSWTVQLGDSDEPVYDYEELEKKLQAFIASHNQEGPLIMEVSLPAYTIREEQDGVFFVEMDLLRGGYEQPAHKSERAAKAFALNLQHAFFSGWKARERELKETLGLTG